MSYSLADLARSLLPRPAGGRALSAGERRTLESVVEVFLDGAPVVIGREQAAANIDRFLVAGRSRRAWRVRVLLEAIELSSVPTHRRSFSRLPLAARRAIVRDRWQDGHHIYRLLGKVRNLAVLGIYGDAAAANATGYVPVPLRPRFQDTSRDVHLTSAKRELPAEV